MRLMNLVAASLVMAGVAACASHDDENAKSTAYGSGDAGTGSEMVNSGENSAPLDAAALQAARVELKTKVGDTVLFHFDSSEVSPEGKEIVSRQAAYMQHYPSLTFTIEGHCDERGTREYNLALGERRATSVKTALEALGIPEQRLQTISYGKERPVAVGSGEAAAARNRRAVTVIN